MKLHGWHTVISRLEHDPGSVECVFIQTGRRDARARKLEALATASGVKIARVSRRELDRLGGGVHQGVVADCMGGEEPLGEEDLGAIVEGAQEETLVLVLDGVTDPRNLGACIRTADAAGASAVVFPKRRSASLTESARKAASGAAESMPFIAVTNLARALRALKDRGVWLIGADGEAQRLWCQVNYRRPVALVLGSEGRGLRRLTREHCDELVRLPMAGGVSSLNVSVAAGVCMFEIVRQRLHASSAPA